MWRKYNYKMGRKPLKSYLLTLLIIVLILTFTGLIIYFVYNKIVSVDPLPVNIKNQAIFKIAYPASHSAVIDNNSYKYLSDQNILSFNAKYADAKIAFTEQQAPPSLGKDDQPYYQAIGIHPYAQIKSKLGTVALTRFYESETLKLAGQSAVLASKGTLLLARSDKNLTNDQWKNLFDSLKFSK